jgi:hypothetical protein
MKERIQRWAKLVKEFKNYEKKPATDQNAGFGLQFLL